MRICVIDDHRVNLEVLQSVLAAVPSWRVEGFLDPFLALVRCESIEFDLVLVDHEMPGLNGVELIRRLRASSRYAHVPVVMVTVDRSRALRLEAIRAGATDFLTKPVDPDELRLRAANLIALRRAHLALAEHAAHLAEEIASQTHQIARRKA